MTIVAGNFDTLIIGAGHGGAQAAVALRQTGYIGSIGVIGEEPELPYERPPLSKDYLAGEKPFDRMLIRPAAFWAERGVIMLAGQRVVAVDAAAQTVSDAAGDLTGYETLIWATGGHPRKLTCPGHDLAGLHAIRTRADVDALKADLVGARTVVIVGGGYIGLEAAAVLAKQGLAVTVLEAMDRVLARVAGPEISTFYEAEHRAHGVTLRTGVMVTAVVGENGGGENGRATGVVLANGETIAADAIIVGIGIVPAVEPLLAAGAAMAAGGVLVDDHCRTSLPNIFAIGDCAGHANAFAGGATIRLESVQNANDMAATVARAMTGSPRPYHAVPWFWSNQYDLRLQTVGLSLGHDATVLRGDIVARAFSLIYLKAGRVIALDCVNAVRDYVQGKLLVETGAIIAPEALADSGVPLKHWHPTGNAA